MADCAVATREDDSQRSAVTGGQEVSGGGRVQCPEGRTECQVSRFSPDIKFKIPIDVSRYRASQVDDFTRAGVKGRVHQIRNVLLVGNPFNSWLF